MSYLVFVLASYWIPFILTSSIGITNAYSFVLTFLLTESRKINRINLNLKERAFVISVFHIFLHLVTNALLKYGWWYSVFIGSVLTTINLSTLANL